MALPTFFAPAERAEPETITRQAALFEKQSSLVSALNSVLNYVLILNQQRQIVFASENVSTLLPSQPASVLGQRPGEALGCVHSAATSGGCGTSLFCRECGAVKSIIAGLAGQKDCQECRMIRHNGTQDESLDLLVSSTPTVVQNETFDLMAFMDISHEKRRHALEHVFFHDLINTAGGLEGLSSMLCQDAPPLLIEDLKLLHTGLCYVLEEILTQRDLLAAEASELLVTPVSISLDDLLRNLVRFYESHPVVRGQEIILLPVPQIDHFVTDAGLLRRVVGNLLKNAIEASKAEQPVTLSCVLVDDGIEIRVHNTSVMSMETQLQVFNRSFSTKGKNRGLGTYGAKLLTERYMGGKISFASHEGEGTTFFLWLPFFILASTSKP